MPAESLKIFGSFTGTGFSPTTSDQHRRALPGGFDFSLRGTFVATIELQRKVGDTGDFEIVGDPFTASAQRFGSAGSINTEYRFECTAFTSGEAFFEAIQ